MADASAAQTVTLQTHGGPMQGQLYLPKGEGKHGAVIVIPEVHGLAPGITIECQRLAEAGYLALGIEIFHRTAPAGWQPKSTADFSEVMPHFSKLTDAGLAEDLTAAKAFLRQHPSSNGKTGVIGFCIGGYTAYLGACETGLDASVVYYGGGIVTARPQYNSLSALLSKKVTAPVLGLFGKDDPSIPESDRAAIDAELTKQHVEHEIIAYEGAGHAFRNETREHYAPAQAAESWKKALEFLGKKLS